MARTTAQAKFTVDADILASFRRRCLAGGASMASQITRFMETCPGSCPGQKAGAPAVKTRTRGQRREAVRHIIGMLADVLESEDAYRGNIPEAFAGRIDAAEQTAEMLGEAIALLLDAY